MIKVRELVYDVRNRLKLNNDDSQIKDKHIRFLLGQVHAEHIAREYLKTGSIPPSAYVRKTYTGAGRSITDGVGRVLNYSYPIGFCPLDIMGDAGFIITSPKGLRRYKNEAEVAVKEGGKFFDKCKAYYRDSENLFIGKELQPDEKLEILMIPHLASLGMDDRAVGGTDLWELITERTVRVLLNTEKLKEDYRNDGSEDKI